MQKLNIRRTICIGAAFLSISAFWQLYDNIVPQILKYSFNLGETVSGAIMALDNLLAIFLLPLFGGLSDRTNTRLGKRTPFILVGTILATAIMLLIPTAANAKNLILFFVALGAVLIAMGTYRSPAVAILEDKTTERAQVQVESTYCGDAVHVVVTVDHNALLYMESRGNTLHRLLHITQQKGVMEQRGFIANKGSGLFGSCISPVDQQLCGKGMQLQSICQQSHILMS